MTSKKIPVILNEVKDLVYGRKNKKISLKEEEKLDRNQNDSKKIPVILNEVKELVCGRKNKKICLKGEDYLDQNSKLLICIERTPEILRSQCSLRMMESLVRRNRILHNQNELLKEVH